MKSISKSKCEKLSERVITELKACVKNGDTESAHSNADSILCELLIELGFNEVVKEYEKVDKWYA